ncbi:fatty acyl-AMP ligase [Nocardia colli]|uniref:fatty acyl-AMP ligase n=1 Tax=Nocardia colli TaxID=2545717 RepID=UPI00168D90FB|nr:fatty acyl-AMP ligase [Nocardia colli]
MFNTFVETLFAQVDNRPTDLLFRFLETGDVDGAVREISYADLGIRARAIASALQDSKPRRALLLYPAGLEFVEAFFGCLAAGVIAVPAPPPTREIRSLCRLRRIAANAEPDVVLAPSRIVVESVPLCAEIPELSGLRWITSDQIGNEEAAVWREPDLGPDSIALIQYTSGSTTAPRGVLISHENLLHNQHALAVGLGHDQAVAEQWDGALFASWLPMYRDMGLIAPLLHTVYLGANSVLMSTLHFLQRPERWLQAISTFRAHTSGGPDFAYDLCARRIAPDQIDHLDLSRWQVAFNGSEPVQAATIRQFSNAFGRVGFRAESHHPVYGLAEATLLVTASPPRARPTFHEISRQGSAQNTELVGGGHAVEGMSIAVVDPATGIAHADRVEGEIWVAGNSVAAGYFRDQQATSETFGATMPGNDHHYLRTGDLGFLSEGELFVTGRSTELLIVQGRNHNPLDIESTVESAHDIIRAGCVAAFSVGIGPDGGQPVVVAEARGTDHHRLADAANAVCAAVATEHGLILAALLLIQPGTMFKTDSGRVQRLACRAAYMSGELHIMFAKDKRADSMSSHDWM